jgi:uncharacterized protein
LDHPAILRYLCHVFSVHSHKRGGAGTMTKKGEPHGRSAMELRISGLSDGDYPFDFTADANEIGADSLVGDVVFRGTLRKFSHQFYVSGRASGSYLCECDRCLAETEREISTPVEIYFSALAEGQAGSDMDDAETRWLQPDQESIVLDDEVRQSLLLAIPLKALCREDCRGLCPECGADLNVDEGHSHGTEIDPRWAKLAEIHKLSEN